jgi:CRISPR system Cascade subunit CasE
MNEPLFLSRLRLRHDASIAALAPVLNPDDDTVRVDLGHRLMWAVFSDSADRRRDFLWREDDRGRYLALSRRAPIDGHSLFEIETKPFKPALGRGDRLRFALRANAVATRKDGAGKPKRRDLVLEGLKRFPENEYALHRDRVAMEAGAAWVRAQGEKSGFEVDDIDACAYRKVRMARNVTLGLLDIDGRIRVREPELFLRSLGNGFGKAKGFGCGLMLIRRAR